jgi:ketosteroid isomerase-like protein
MKTLHVFRVTLALSSILSVSAQAQQNKDLHEVKKAIAESNALYFKSSENNDISIFMARYAEDACLLQAGKPIACGSEVLTHFFKNSYERGVRGGKFETTEVFGDGVEYVTEVGNGQVWDANKTIMNEFKYMVLWKKTRDGWKMYRDAFSTNLEEGKK